MTSARRRRLLIGSGVVAVALGSGLGASYAFARAEDAVEAVLRRRLRPLEIDEAEIAKFSKDYVRTRSQYRSQLRLLGSLSALYRMVTPYELLSMRSPLRRLEDNIVSSFLLATDFFEHGADMTRSLRYSGMHDPYVRPCRRLFVS